MHNDGDLDEDRNSRESSAHVRSCVRDKIKHDLLARIQSGEYAAGTRLKELVLAQEFRVSQAPIREVLRELEALGVLETQRYRGTRVRNVDEADRGEAYALRAHLEERAALRAVPVGATALAALQNAVDAVIAAAERGDSEAYALRNVEFHRGVVALAGSTLLQRVWDSLGWDLRTRQTLRHIGRDDLVRFARSHQPIVDALRSGDGALAGRLLRTHAESLGGTPPQTHAN